MGAFNLPPLNALRVFEVAARLGSFKAAAEELCVTPSAVSHQVANLEAVLKISLFHRDGRRLLLSDAGETYRRNIHDALNRLSQATEEVVRGAMAPTLTILAAPSIAGKWLMPRLDNFLCQNPELRVHIEATAEPHHLGDADVGIFYGAPADPAAMVRPIIAERILVLCSPTLLKRGPPLRRPADLAGHVLIHTRTRLPWRSWLAASGLEDMVVRREMSVGRSTMAIEAALKGLGVILESDFLAADEIRDGRLVEPFEGGHPAPVEDAYFLSFRGGLPEGGPAALFINWLDREVGANRTYLSVQYNDSD